MKRTIGLAALAALAMTARQAGAQAPTSPLPGGQSNPPAQTTPAPGRPAATTPPAATAGAATANDPTTVDTFQQLHDVNAKLIHLGKLAAERGTTTNVKEYGQRLIAEHQRLDQELSQMAQRRGIPLAPAEQLTADPTHMSGYQHLVSLSGLEFDRAFMDALVGEREGRSEHLKQLRDRTPGKDAELKKWTDNMQDVMEKTRNEARNVRQAVREAQSQQRQGRTPQ